MNFPILTNAATLQRYFGFFILINKIVKTFRAKSDKEYVERAYNSWPSKPVNPNISDTFVHSYWLANGQFQ